MNFWVPRIRRLEKERDAYKAAAIAALVDLEGQRKVALETVEFWCEQYRLIAKALYEEQQRNL